MNMPNARNGHFSDLDGARRLAASLTSVTRNPPRIEEEGFVNFAAPNPAGSIEPPPPTRLERLTFELPSESTWGVELWQQLLQQALRQCGGDAGLLFDRHGLVIAQAGSVDQERAEDWASRVQLIIDQAAHLQEGPWCSVSVELAGRWLSAARRTRNPNDTGDWDVTLALFAQQPAVALAKRALEAAFARLEAS